MTGVGECGRFQRGRGEEEGGGREGLGASGGEREGPGGKYDTK